MEEISPNDRGLGVPTACILCLGDKKEAPHGAPLFVSVVALEVLGSASLSSRGHDVRCGRARGRRYRPGHRRHRRHLSRPSHRRRSRPSHLRGRAA